MTTEPTISRISLAVEQPAFEDAARNMCAALLPNAEIQICPLPDFSDSLDRESDVDTLNVLMLQCDASGLLDPGVPVAQSLLSTPAPVLVTRWNGIGNPPMLDIRRVVVPLDGSAMAAQAIPIASRVAKAVGAPVRFVMVIDPSRVIPPAYAYDPDAWNMIEELRQTSHWALSQAEHTMRSDGVSVDSELLFGPINASLMASIGDGDLVVMTTHGPHRHALRNRESVVMRTLVSVPQPMLIQQASRETPVVVDGYQACSWAEPLRPQTSRTA